MYIFICKKKLVFVLFLCLFIKCGVLYGEAEIKPLDYKTGAKVKIPAVLNLSGSLWFNGDDFAY